MTYQAYLDDSGDDEIFVLAGHIASAEQWGRLSAGWEKLLRNFGTLGKGNTYHFKMNEMAMNEERFSRIGPFFRLIEENLPITIACWVRHEDIRRANARFQVRGQNFDLPDEIKPFRIVFRAILNTLSDNIDLLKDRLDIDFPIEFIFDDQSEKGDILSGWGNYYRNSADGMRMLLSAPPKFEDDRKFLPLQAADFQAWWVRKWRATGANEWEVPSNFAGYRPIKERMGIDIHVSEKDIADVLRLIYRRKVPSGPLYELRPAEEISFSMKFSARQSR